ncbi:MAG TPA: YibE/F family protein, partial [Actinomycetota bacterium]|nr:YibE/F family protein [Actinomycetota bacterium]
MDTSGNRHRLLLAVVGLLVLAVLAGAVALWPSGRLADPAAAGQADPTRFVPATLTSVRTVPCQEAEPGVPGSTCIKVRARPDGGDEVEFDTTDPTGDTFRAGQRVRLSILEQAGQPTFYNIRDLERGRPMLALAALFMLAVIAFGRWQGVRSLIGLACSFAVIVGFVVPAILEGGSPVPVALVGAMAIMLLSLYLAHGPGRKTTAAVVGTALALGLTAALTAGFVELAALTGLASEDALDANFQVGGISLRGLLLAGIILGGLGVLDDVTVSQASLVFELRRADPAAGFAGLTRGALAVGRDHVSATVNTLFLAYAGASLPLLVLFVSGGEALATVATAEVMAVEVVRALCGSVGLIAAVPLTTLLAASLALEEPAAGPGAPAPAGTGRAPYSPARGMDPGDAAALF